MALSKPSPHTKLAIDGSAATSTDAKLAAITASLKRSLEQMKQTRTEAILAATTARLKRSLEQMKQTHTLHASNARRLGLKEEEWQATTTPLSATLAEIRHLHEGMERRRDSMARQVKVSSVTASTTTSSTVTQHASRPAAPTCDQLEVAPPAQRPPELVSFQVAGRTAEPFSGDLVVDYTGEGVGLMDADERCSLAGFNGPQRPPASALVAPLLLMDRIGAPGDQELALQLDAPKVFEEIPGKTSAADTTKQTEETLGAEPLVVWDDDTCDDVITHEELELELADEVFTCMGGSSLFLESDIDSAYKVFEDDVLTTVRGVSLFLELDMDYDVGVLTHVGGLPLFLELPMNSHKEPESAADTTIGLGHVVNGVQTVYLIMPIEASKNIGSLDLIMGSRHSNGHGT